VGLGNRLRCLVTANTPNNCQQDQKNSFQCCHLSPVGNSASKRLAQPALLAIGQRIAFYP